MASEKDREPAGVKKFSFRKKIFFKETNQPNSATPAWWQPAITMFLRLSAWIATPVIIALFFGKWLDKKFDSAPWLFLTCTFAAFIISMVGLIRNTLSEYKKIESAKQADKNNQEKSDNDKK